MRVESEQVRFVPCAVANDDPSPRRAIDAGKTNQPARRRLTDDKPIHA